MTWWMTAMELQSMASRRDPSRRIQSERYGAYVITSLAVLTVCRRGRWDQLHGADRPLAQHAARALPAQARVAGGETVNK
jgi:hypothetical protein